MRVIGSQLIMYKQIHCFCSQGISSTYAYKQWEKLIHARWEARLPFFGIWALSFHMITQLCIRSLEVKVVLEVLGTRNKSEALSSFLYTKDDPRNNLRLASVSGPSPRR